MTDKQFQAARNCDAIDEIYMEIERHSMRGETTINLQTKIDEIYDLLDIAAKSFPIKALAGEIYTGQGSSKAESTLRGELNQQPGHKLGLVTALQIMQKTQDLRALDKIEEMFDRVAARIPAGQPNDVRPLMKLNADLIRDFGDNMKALGNALKDGSIDAQEAKVCLRELKELITACIRLETYLNHQFSSSSSVGATGRSPLHGNREVLHER